MKKTVFFGALTVAGLVAGMASAATLDDVKARGSLNCGVTTGLIGFAAPNAEGEWEGFDVGVCRAVAAAIFGDPTAVEFVPTTGQTRFTALASGEIDLLARNTTWTMSRDVDLKFEFVGVNYYDGQGFMVPKALGVTSAKELDGATVCIQTGTTTELNLADFFRSNGISYEPVPIETNCCWPITEVAKQTAPISEKYVIFKSSISNPSIEIQRQGWQCHHYGQSGDGGRYRGSPPSLQRTR